MEYVVSHNAMHCTQPTCSLTKEMPTVIFNMFYDSLFDQAEAVNKYLNKIRLLNAKKKIVLSGC